MDCPKCQVPLIIVERNKIEVDYCLSCKGIWFDSEELALLNQALQLDLPISDATDFDPVECNEQKMKCPRCNKPMGKVVPAGTNTPLVDRCPTGHGLWFDAGELGQLFRSENQTGTSRVVEFLGEVFGK